MREESGERCRGRSRQGSRQGSREESKQPIEPAGGSKEADQPRVNDAGKKSGIKKWVQTRYSYMVIMRDGKEARVSDQQAGGSKMTPRGRRTRGKAKETSRGEKERQRDD